MQVAILGPLRVDDAGQPVAIGGARLRALLVRLAAETGRWVGGACLAAALWPDDDAPADQANALQSLVSRLRRALPDPGLIESGPAGYRLLISADDLDAARFEAEITQGRRELAAGRTAAGADRLRAALGLWRGVPLGDVPGLPFAATWAGRLDELRLSALEDRIDADLRLGRTDGLVAELEELVAGHPLRERLHGQLMRALYAGGRQGEALAAYERLRRLLADDLGVDPSPQLQALQLSVLRGEDSEPPDEPRREEPAARRTNLRPALTSFVGREQDAEQVRLALGRSRLVTLVGAGGAGKTRLAAEVAGQLEEIGRDGIWMAELAPVSDPDGLAGAALGAIGERDGTRLDSRPPVGHQDDLTRLAGTIGERDVVLLLDNCEHVIDAAAKLAEQLLGQCPRLRVLATSREPLGITGESLWPVRPLATPDSSAGLDGMLSTPAVRLFADRAVLVRPGFAIDQSNHAAVSEICRRLDGLPLAIELAAARLRTLSPQSVAARLEDRFRLLTGGSRTAMPRHQTLRAVVAWSWDLLGESERRLAEQLSVFPGGATAPAAAAVAVPASAGGPGLDADEVLDRLSALADKSLLVVMDGEEPRYRMLETIREFSAERLAERGQVAPVRAAFTGYFVHLAERAEPRLRGHDQLAALQQLNDERENLFAAIRFAAQAQDASSAIRLGAALAWYWTLLGRHDDAASSLRLALSVPGDSPPEAYLIALVIGRLSAAAIGDGLPSQEERDRLAMLAKPLAVPTSHPLVALVGPVLAALADDDQGLQSGIEDLLSHQDPWALAMLHLLDAVSAENAGDLDRLRRSVPEALMRFRALGDRWGIGTALGVLANVHGMDGDLAAAVTALRENRQLMLELRATDDESYATVRMGLLLLQDGDLAGARAEITHALDIGARSGSAMGESFATLGQAMVLAAEGDRTTAREWGQRALSLLERSRTGPPQISAMTLATLAHLDLEDGDLGSAAGLLVRAWEPMLGSRDMPVTARLATTIAELAFARGEAEPAARMIGAGEALRGGPDLGDPDLALLRPKLVAALGDAACAEQVAAGRSLDRPEALTLLATWLGIPEPP